MSCICLYCSMERENGKQVNCLPKNSGKPIFNGSFRFILRQPFNGYKLYYKLYPYLFFFLLFRKSLFEPRDCMLQAMDLLKDETHDQLPEGQLRLQVKDTLAQLEQFMKTLGCEM